ncbi:aldo/keto reductase [Nonomuraea sp. B12E4]|uniref:aldo/keto reductase n=1 Tax=Nonomuraea sp. B12E4 TaxID=3153564 RepID=UPI00325EB388
MRSAPLTRRLPGPGQRSRTTPSQVALAWTTLNPGVTAPIVGARTLRQLEDNLGALDLRFSDEQRAVLAEASGIELGFPHDFLARPMPRQVILGGVTIEPRH